jgi:hypothetical protein
MNERTLSELLLADILEGVTAIQERLVSIEERLDANDAREATHRELQVVAELAARAHAAASGSAVPLPADLLSDPILERFLLSHPAPPLKALPGLERWREAARNDATTQQLYMILAYQYRGSPTDTPETLALRFQMAAISREELKRRGSKAPPAPQTTRLQDRSADAISAKNEELIVIWSSGNTPHLRGEPELVAASEMVQSLGEKMAHEDSAVRQPALQALHAEIRERLRAGERPTHILSHPFAPKKDVALTNRSDPNMER